MKILKGQIRSIGARPIEETHEVSSETEGQIGFAASATFSQSGRQGLSRSLDSAIEAVRALELQPIEEPGPEVPPRMIHEDRQLFRKLLKQKTMAAYSVEEIRRTLVTERPHLTRQYVQKVIEPGLNLNRTIDRFGPEPRFLLAAKLAHHLLGAQSGESLDHAVTTFKERTPALKQVWPEFSVADVERLQKIYAFIPRWCSDTKTPMDLSLEHPFDNGTSLETRVWLEQALRVIEEFSKVPLYSPTIETINSARQEHGQLAGCRLIDISHALADKIPMFDSLIRYDGMDGEDIKMLCKHYAGNERMAGLISRMFGVQLERIDDSVTLDNRVEQTVLEAVEGDDKRPLLVHMEGVHRWRWLDGVQKQHPDIPIAGVSHTTSDGKDILDGVEVRFPLEMMSLAESKQNDERDRFRHTFRALIDKLGTALDTDIYQRRFLVKGHGRIIGPSMSDALKGMKTDYAVMDIDTKRRKEARQKHPVVMNVEHEANRRLVVLGCGNGPSVTKEEIASIKKPAIFMQLQTGREAFPMDWVEEKSRDENGIPRRQVVGWLGEQPVVEYTLDIDGEDISHIFVADGYVANLAFPRPTITEYSILTNVLVLESLRQSKWRLDRHQKGDETQRGAHLLETTRIDLTPGKPQRVVSLFDRSVKNLHMKPMKEQVSTSVLRTVLEENKDANIFFRSASSLPSAKKKSKKLRGLPHPGQYRNSLGQCMLKTSSTDGAWQVARPATKTGHYALTIVSHCFQKDAFTYDGAIDDKAMEELIELGKKEGLIKTNRQGKIINIDAFLDELRPYQLDFVQEGARYIHALLNESKSDRVFFEISSEWPNGSCWSDGRANAKLITRLAETSRS